MLPWLEGRRACLVLPALKPGRACGGAAESRCRDASRRPHPAQEGAPKSSLLPAEPAKAGLRDTCRTRARAGTWWGSAAGDSRGQQGH